MLMVAGEYHHQAVQLYSRATLNTTLTVAYN